MPRENLVNQNLKALYNHHAHRPPSEDGEDDENETIEEEDEEEEIEDCPQTAQHLTCYTHQLSSVTSGRSISQNRTRALRYRKAFLGKW